MEDYSTVDLRQTKQTEITAKKLKTVKFLLFFFFKCFEVIKNVVIVHHGVNNR